MSVLVVIPARLASTRLPRKPLLRETGRPLIQHVWEGAKRIAGANQVVVATDAEEIAQAVREFGGEAMMTSPEHASGSDRVAEVARRARPQIVINLQGDEPEFEPADVEALIRVMRAEPGVQMGTLVFPRLTEEEQNTPSVVKAVVREGWAVDFRREPTPGAFRHLGVYGFRAAFLELFTGLAPTPRENERRLEQIRALDHGYRIRAVEATHAQSGIDTAADYAAFVERWRRGLR